MRYILFILLGMSLAWSAAAQELLNVSSADDAPQSLTEEDSGPSIGVDQIQDEDAAMPVNITTNRFEELAKDEEEAAETNEVQRVNVGFLMSVGVEYTDEGEYEEAEKAYLRALEVDAENEDLLFRLGTLYVRMKRYKDAVEVFHGLAERFPNNPKVHNNLAWCYAAGSGVKNMKLALRHAREAILGGPAFPSAWNTLAEAYYLAGDYEKALRSAEHALELFQGTNPEEEKIRAFQMQISKIRRAQEALKILEGRDEDE